MSVVKLPPPSHTGVSSFLTLSTRPSYLWQTLCRMFETLQEIWYSKDSGATLIDCIVLETDSHSWDLCIYRLTCSDTEADPFSCVYLSICLSLCLCPGSCFCLLCSFVFFQGGFSVIASSFHVSCPSNISHDLFCLCHMVRMNFSNYTFVIACSTQAIIPILQYMNQPAF